MCCPCIGMWSSNASHSKISFPAKIGDGDEFSGDDDEITEQALAALRQMFGLVPQPTRVIVTRWGTDEFSFGSYSFVGVGATGADYSTVAEPIGMPLRAQTRN